MKKPSLLYHGTAALFVLGILYKVAPAFWQERWFDSLMHFLGGLSIGLISLWVWYVSGVFGKDMPSRKSVFISAVIFAMLAGTWWEFFEYVNGIAHPIGSYPLDTFNDMLADFVGAVVAGLWGAHRNFYE